MDHPDNQLTLADLLSSLQEELPSIIHNHWIPSAHFLVATKPVATVITNQREIIVVCDTTFRNQPRPDSKPAHAVAYSDSSTGLISPQEYEALDLSQFVVLDKLIITK